MLIIFDLDGTLLNSVADLAAASNHALEKCGFPIHSPEAYPYFVGNGVRKLIERVVPEDVKNVETIDRVLREFTRYYNEHMTDRTLPYPGIIDLLIELKKRGDNIAVASNKYKAGVEHLIHHFFPMVEWSAVEGQQEGVPTKPDPSIVFEILAKCPTPKSEVLYVGDSGVDMITATRAGVESVGVSWGFRPVSELNDAYADHIVNLPEEILQIKPHGLDLDSAISTR